MTRDETIAVLKESSDRVRALGATALFLYGSAARDELRENSDVDIFIDYDLEGPFSFVELIRMRDVISDALRRNVDLTTRAGLHPLLRSDIERSSIKVL